jgi:murein DD-endopeptidase MepM/ murein hydrolase activator NlpD
MNPIAVSLLVIVVAGSGCAKKNNCEGAQYPPQETSEYVLPYAVGTSHKVWQGHCDGFHNDLDHFGTDFLMAIGTPIMAARAGEVTFVEEQYADGDHDFLHSNTVQVTHDDGTFAQYLHLTQNGALVALGDVVEKGQQIGISGFTGKTGDFEHLHFVVFEYLNADGRKSLPVNFKNTSSNPKGPLADETYEALPFQ